MLYRITKDKRSIAQILLEEGSISTLWANKQNIDRLATHIGNLRRKGWVIKTESKLGARQRDHIYTLISKPDEKNTT